MNAPASTWPRLAGWAAVLPALVLALLSAAWNAGVPGGGLWPPDTVNLPEAIATRNSGEVLRLIALGADLNAAAPVRAGLLVEEDVLVTPVEAAIIVRRGEMLKLLLMYGAMIPEAALPALRCYEYAWPDREVQEMLGGPAPEDAGCKEKEEVELPKPGDRRMTSMWPGTEHQVRTRH
jgi:hypothetical protein